MIQTCRNLADRLKKEDKAEQMISEQDITVLGRKLFTFYSQRWMQQIDAVSITYLNSWGELFSETYGIKDRVGKIITYLLEDPSNLKNNYEIFIPKSQYSKKIHTSLEGIIVNQIER